jgi:hypothetical protein
MRNQKKGFMQKPWTKKSHATVPLNLIGQPLNNKFSQILFRDRLSMHFLGNYVGNFVVWSVICASILCNLVAREISVRKKTNNHKTLSVKIISIFWGTDNFSNHYFGSGLKIFLHGRIRIRIRIRNESFDQNIFTAIRVYNMFNKRLMGYYFFSSSTVLYFIIFHKNITAN